MTNLIHRLEAAEGPSRELDAEIAEAIGIPVLRPQHESHRWLMWPAGEDTFTTELSAYTASLDAAVSLVPEHMVLQFLQRRTQPEMGGRMWSATIRGYRLFRSGGQRTPALALCIAALKAREAGDE